MFPTHYWWCVLGTVLLAANLSWPTTVGGPITMFPDEVFNKVRSLMALTKG